MRKSEERCYIRFVFCRVCRWPSVWFVAEERRLRRAAAPVIVLVCHALALPTHTKDSVNHNSEYWEYSFFLKKLKTPTSNNTRPVTECNNKGVPINDTDATPWRALGVDTALLMPRFDLGERGERGDFWASRAELTVVVAATVCARGNDALTSASCAAGSTPPCPSPSGPQMSPLCVPRRMVLFGSYGSSTASGSVCAAMTAAASAFALRATMCDVLDLVRVSLPVWPMSASSGRNFNSIVNSSHKCLPYFFKYRKKMKFKLFEQKKSSTLSLLASSKSGILNVNELLATNFVLNQKCTSLCLASRT